MGLDAFLKWVQGHEESFEYGKVGAVKGGNFSGTPAQFQFSALISTTHDEYESSTSFAMRHHVHISQIYHGLDESFDMTTTQNRGNMPSYIFIQPIPPTRTEQTIKRHQSWSPHPVTSGFFLSIPRLMVFLPPPLEPR
ncbi:hypothetical protein ACRALDRAFT_206915 [Sodiomyces alcalophilus JCM 7366]|uniref:uncharacterized protein n=1 Tax=Sodiomyces alcalophilus JCM 7366 TaxID=591952 RepID=UPI0039B65345